MKNTTQNLLENDQLGVLEGLFGPNEAAENWQIQCLKLYAQAEKAMTIEEIIRFTQNALPETVGEEQRVQLVSRMVGQQDWIDQGLLTTEKNGQGDSVFAISDKGLSMLWDSAISKNSEAALERYGRVIALNKKLNAPTRVIESHDLYALTLLAILQLQKTTKKRGGTSTEVRALLVDWVKPTGINAEVTESEKKYTNPLNRFERKFTNMFSSHNQIEKDGLLERKEANGETIWNVTEAGKALLVRRTLRDHRNLNLILKANSLTDRMGSYLAVMDVLSGLSANAPQDVRNSFKDVLTHVEDLVRADSTQVREIKARLDTAETLGPMKKPKMS
jgi:hypothetical protein